MTAKGTAIPFFTAVTDIGRLLEFRAEFFFKVFADLEAGNTAFGAVLRPFVFTGRADIPAVLAGASVNTGIAAAAAVFDDEMLANFLRER